MHTVHNTANMHTTKTNHCTYTAYTAHNIANTSHCRYIIHCTTVYAADYTSNTATANVFTSA